MSSYATTADMRARFPHDELVQLTDDAGGGAIDDARLARAIDDAEEWIDSYLAAKYLVPVTPVPNLLVAYACDVARHDLQLARGGASEAVAARFGAIERHLRDIGAGKAQLGVNAAGDEVAAESGAGPSFSAPDRMFSGDTLKDF